MPEQQNIFPHKTARHFSTAIAPPPTALPIKPSYYSTAATSIPAG